MRRLLVLAAAVIAGAAAPAPLQVWKAYGFPDAGFSVQFPSEPKVAEGQFGKDGVPARTWSVAEDGLTYSVTVADYRGLGAAGDGPMTEAIEALKGEGRILVDASERIDRSFGHDITLAAKDGGRWAVAVFYVDGRLYELIGKATPEAAERGSSRTARFQQTLVFIDADGGQPRRPDDGLAGSPNGRGPGGPPPPGGLGRRGPPPPQAYSDCVGKTAGETVQHSTPQGVVAAICVAGPQGLFARPDVADRGQPGQP